MVHCSVWSPTVAMIFISHCARVLDLSSTLPCTFLTWSLGLSVFFALNSIHKLSLRLLPQLFTLPTSHLPGNVYFPSVLLIFLPQQNFLLFNLLHLSTLIVIVYIYVSILK